MKRVNSFKDLVGRIFEGTEERLEGKSMLCKGRHDEMRSWRGSQRQIHSFPPLIRYRLDTSHVQSTEDRAVSKTKIHALRGDRVPAFMILADNATVLLEVQKKTIQENYMS
jgi:hypothetical protein